MKRLLSLLLVIAMLFGICTMFAACDSSSSVSDKDDDDDDKKKDDDEDDDVEPTLVLMGLKIVLPEDFEMEDQDEFEGDGSAYAVFTGICYGVSISCGPLSGDTEGMNAEELRDYMLEQMDPENEEAEVGEYDTGSKNKTPYLYAIKDDETMALVMAFYVDDDYAWQVRIMSNEDSKDFNVKEMTGLITGWKYKAPSAEDNEDEGSDEDDPEYPTQAPPEDIPTEPTAAPAPQPSEPEEPENVKYLLMSSVRTYYKSETDIVITETVYYYDYYGYLTMITETVNGATETTTVTCDAYGNPCVLVDNEVTETRTYNAQNQLIYSYFSDGKEITYTYDENGWLIKEETVSPNGGHYIAYTYDENGLKLTAATYDQYGCALSSRFTYDDAGRVIRIDYRSNGLNRYELYTYEDTSDGYMKIATQYNHLDKVEVTQVYTYVKVPQ